MERIILEQKTRNHIKMAPLGNSHVLAPQDPPKSTGKINDKIIAVKSYFGIFALLQT